MSEHTRNWHERAFFGLHYDLHATAEDSELGQDVTPTLLREAWQTVRPDWVQCDCKGHPGYTSWPTTVGTASPGIVRDALRVHRDVSRELGLPLAVHYSGVWDSAAVAGHPDWARMDADGRRDPDKVCLTSPYTDSLMIPQMIEVIDRYDVDGFWVDGDNWAAGPCWCERCRARFAEESAGAAAPGAPEEPHWAEWLAFHRRCFEEHVRRYTTAVHERKPGCLVCSNWLYSVRQPDPVTLPVDFLSGDFSHAWGVQRAIAEARMLDSRGLPWDLMAWGFTTGEGIHDGWQYKPAAHLCQEVAEVIANGGAVCVYSLPERGGHLVGWQHETLAEVGRFLRARQPVSQGSTSVPQATVLHSRSHYYAHNSPLYAFGRANAPMEGALHALLDCGRHADLRTEDDLLDQLDAYALVVVAEQEGPPGPLAAALAAYAARGGRLLLSGAHLAVDPALAKLAGVEAAGAPRSGFHYLPIDGASVTVAGPWQPVRLAGAAEWAALLQGPEPGRDAVGAPAITIREVGRGRVAAVHGPVFAAYGRTHYPSLRRLLSQLLRDLWPAPLSEAVAPGQVAHTLRRQGERLVVHLLNRAADPPTSPSNVMVERVPPVGPVTVRLRLPTPPSAVNAAPDPSPVEWSWQDGQLTVSVAQVHIHAALVVEGVAEAATSPNEDRG